MPQQQLLQQQRTARIDQIMKLFPEQNGNLLSSLQNQASQQPHQQTQLQQQQPQQLHHINYPLAMECDPTPVSTSSSTSAPMSSRYNLLLAGIGANNIVTSNSGCGNNYAHIHRSGRYPSMTVMGTNHALIGSNAIASANNANNVLHHGSKSSSNLLSNYAPASLPIDLGQMMVSSAIGNNSTVDHSLSAYQHHHLLTSANPNNAITGGGSSSGGYIPYSMSSDAIIASMPTNNQVQIASSNKNLSNPSSGTSSSVSGQSATAASRSSGATANDRGDESPMVGVCVQQSPVVIH